MKVLRYRLIRIRVVIAVAAILVALGGCGMPFEWTGAVPTSWTTGAADPPTTGGAPSQSNTATSETIIGASFTLAWDDDDSVSTGSYRVYVRPYGGDEWNLLAANLGTGEYTVSTTVLAYGSYEFAVSRVDSDGVESPLHHSYDETAAPAPWYLIWRAS